MSKFNGRYELPNGMVLTLGVNEFSDIEDATGMGALKFIEETGKKTSFSGMRLIFHIALKEDQPGITITEAGKILDKYPDSFTALMVETFGDGVGGEEVGNVSKVKPVTGRPSRKSK